MIAYVPTPVKIPASINQPQDVIDNVVVGTVNPMNQAALNAAKYLQDIADNFGMWRLTASTVTTTGNKIQIAGAIVGGTGYGVSAGLVTVPIAGIYRVTVGARVQISAPSGIADIGLDLMTDVIVGQILGKRWSGATEFCPIAGDYLVRITNPSTQKIAINNNTGYDITTGSGTLTPDVITIQRVN